MKKLLAMLGAAGLVVSTGAVLVSCGEEPEAPVETTQEITITEGTKFDKAVEESTIAIASVKLDDKAVEGDFTIAATVDAETKMIVTGTLTAPKELAVGTYTVSLEADEFKAPGAFEEAEPTKVVTTFEFTIEAEKIDTKALTEAINSANEALEAVAEPAEGTAKTLQDAIDAAELVVITPVDEKTVADAVKALNSAVEEFNTANEQTTPGVDTKALTEAINSANEALEAVAEPAEGTAKTLQDAIDAAELVVITPVDEKTVADAVKALNSAVEEFNIANEDDENGGGSEDFMLYYQA